MKKPTLTIGIPVYNEANNMASLLAELISQQTPHLDLDKIYVISDGSTDHTVTEAQKINSSVIKIFEYHHRVGPAQRQNQLISLTSSDILVILNGDIQISDPFFLEKLTAPIIIQKAQLTSAAIYELPPRTFFESILGVSMLLKRIFFGSINNGNNLYNCHGAARAFHRSLYQKVHFETNEGEDMYSYICCLKHQFKFVYARNAGLYYRSPTTFGDHLKQSVRYLKAQGLLGEMADAALVKDAFSIPYLSIVKANIKAMPIILRYPLHFLLYICVLATVKLCAFANIYPTSTWNVLSSKIVRIKS